METKRDTDPATQHEWFMKLLEEAEKFDEAEFERLEGEKSFRFEYAHESLTEKTSRFKRNSSY